MGDNTKNENAARKVKLKKKDNINTGEQFRKEKKNLYKNKIKLQSNASKEEDNIVLYKEGMTVKDLATALNVKDNELIAKMFTIGLMININSSISFEDAEVIVLEFNKELKKEGIKTLIK